MQSGQRIDLFHDLVLPFTVYAPIGELKIFEKSTPWTYNGITQTLKLFSRSPFGYAPHLGCTTPDFYQIAILAGTRNLDHMLDSNNMRIQAIRPWRNPDPPCRFTVMDGNGLIYDRTEAICPFTAVTCEGTCLPGGSRIGSCCVDCSDLTGNLEAIREAVRRI